MTPERWPIPQHWKWSKAREIAQIIGGGTPHSTDDTNFEDGGIPWITPADLTGYTKTFIGRGRRGLSEKGLSSCGAKVMPTGTVLFSSRAPIGYCAIASNPVSTNQGFKSLILRNGHSPEFVRYYLLASKDFAESLASGTTFRELSGSRLAELPIPIPPADEQRRIVAKLDRLLARSNAVREGLDRIPALVERYKQAVLEAAVRGDLTGDWREENTDTPTAHSLHQELLDTRRSVWERQGRKHAYKLSTEKYDVPPELPKLPESWRYVPVEHLSSKVVDGVHKKPDYRPQGIPFLTVRNLTAGDGIEFSNVRYVSKEDHAVFCGRADPSSGDILITKDGTLGVVRAIRSREIFSIFVSLALVKPVMYEMTDYLELAFQSPVMQGQMVGVGTGLQHIHLTDLKKDLVPIAPLAEQAVIVARVRQAFLEADRK